MDLYSFLNRVNNYDDSSNDNKNKKTSQNSFSYRDSNYIEKFQLQNPDIVLDSTCLPPDRLCRFIKKYSAQKQSAASFYNSIRDVSFTKWLKPFYNNLHQRRRFDRAKKENIRFFLIDKPYHVGFCLSSSDYNEHYLVSYEVCTCPDYEKHMCPCKHMYALALRLGAIQPDHFMYPIPKDRADLLSSLYKQSPYVVDTFYSYLVKLSDDKMYTRIYREEVVLHTNCDFTAMQILADNGFIKIASPSDFDFLDYVETTYTIDDFKKEALSINPLCKFPSGLRKHDLFEYICSNDPYLTDFIYHKCFHIIISQEYVNFRHQYKEYIFYECEKHSYDWEIYD